MNINKEQTEESRQEKTILIIDGKPIIMTPYFKLKWNDKCPQCGTISERK